MSEFIGRAISDIYDEDGYEIYDCPDDFEVVSLFYDKDQNIFKDENGYMIWNMYEYVSPTDLYMFLHRRECMYFRHAHISDTLCELYYPSRNMCEE